MNALKRFFLALAAVVALPLVAQEPWDPHFKLTVGMVGNAEDKQIGQNKVYGVALAGAYQLTIHGSVVAEGGYKIFPTTSLTINDGTAVVDDQSDMFFAGVMYRHELWRNGLYVQGGLRVTNARTIRDTVFLGAGENGKNLKESLKADRHSKAGWALGVSYRLTDLWSVELGASSASFKNLAGQQINSTIFEVALCIHR